MREAGGFEGMREIQGDVRWMGIWRDVGRMQGGV